MKPELLVLLLTTRCNLSCSYCYLACTQRGKDMPLTVFEAVLEKVAYPPREIILSGGEPTLYPALKEVVQVLREKFPQSKISLQTNGTLLNRKLAAFLWTHRIGIGLSLDGPPEINERSRGETQAVVKALKLLSALGIGCGVTVTVTRENASRLGEVVFFLAQFPTVASFGLDLLRPIGRAQERDLPQAPELEQGLKSLEEALSWLMGYGRRLIWREARQGGSRRGYCPAERGKSMVLTPWGDLYPCASLVGHRQYLLGNVFDPEPRPKPLPSACTGCVQKDTCVGRCPSRALVSTRAAALDCLIRKFVANHPVKGLSIDKQVA